MLQITLVLKDTIRKDPRFRMEETNIGETMFYSPRFGSAHLSGGRNDRLTHWASVDDFMAVKIPPEFADYVAGVELNDSFNCLNERRQGHYRLEENGATAEAYLRRSFEKDGPEPGPAYDWETGEADDDYDPSAPDTRPTYVNCALAIRASSTTLAIKLYRAIRAGKARPVEDWDAPMSDAR